MSTPDSNGMIASVPRPITATMPRRALIILLLLVAEAVLLEAAFQLLPDLECTATGAEATCLALRGLFARGLASITMLAIFAWARPAGIATLGRAADARGTSPFWIGVHVTGVALLFLPILLIAGRSVPDFFALALGPWLLGAALAAIGAIGWFAPFRAWWHWLRTERFLPVALVAIASLLPNLIVWVQPIWNSTALASGTFAAVDLLLGGLGQTPISDPPRYIIGLDSFIVEINRQCAGVEGFVLIAAFLCLYAFLFRSDTRFPHFWLLLPAAMLLSWLFNVIRITALIMIGGYVSPALAVNGFHSYAGWILFTILALTILVVARSLSWLRLRPAGEAEAAAPLRQDWNAARVLPFVAFMAASMLGSALFESPEAAYPFKAAVMLLALLPFVHLYRAIEWRLDPAAVVAGLGVAVLWVAPSLLAADAAAGSSGQVPSLAWILIRLAGTILLVPLIEELFFRDYLLERLDTGGRTGTIVAVAISTAIFAALHGRWLLAVIAGLVLCVLRLRSGRVADAVVCHLVANAGVATFALATGNWSLI